MSRNEPLLLVRTEDSWWRAGDATDVEKLDLSMRAGHALFDAGVRRVADVRDLDLERFAGRRGVGARTVEEIALLRDVVRYRARAPSPDRAAFEAALPRNRIPPSWQTVLEDDRVEALGLSKRARGALAAAGAATARDLLDLTLVELRAQRSIGTSTVVELEDLFRVLHWRFSPISLPREKSLDGFFEAVCPRPPSRRRSATGHAVLSRYLGLHPGDLGPWPTQTAVAADLGITPSAVYSVVSRARAAWRHPRRRHIRGELKDVLEQYGGKLTAAELAKHLLARRGSAASAEVRRRRAGAVVRAGAEGEASRGGAAWFRAYRRSGEVFVALADQVPRTCRPEAGVQEKATGESPRLLSKLERSLLHVLARQGSAVEQWEIRLEWDYRRRPGRRRRAKGRTPEWPAIETALQRLERLGFIEVLGKKYRLTPWGIATTTLCRREFQRRHRGWRQSNRFRRDREEWTLELADFEVLPDRLAVGETFEGLAIDYLDLPPRARRSLKGYGLTTIGALAAKRGLGELEGIGGKTVEDIEMQLWPMDLRLLDKD